MARFPRLHPLLWSAAILTVACSDNGPLGDPTAPEAPGFTIADATRGFRAGFYWLPPMVSDPATSGEFDDELSPAG